MAKAEGREYSFAPTTELANDVETFEFQDTDLIIKIENPEFSAVCPFSGLPDIANIKLHYKPSGGKCLELKSLKYYFTSFRPVGIYQEAVTTKIFEDMKRILSSESVWVETVYNVRGGLSVTCTRGEEL